MAQMSFSQILFAGLIFMCLCGAAIGAAIAATLGERLRKWMAVALIRLLSTMLLTVAIIITWTLAGKGLVGFFAALLVCPFINELTAWHPTPFTMAALLDVGVMALVNGNGK